MKKAIINLFFGIILISIIVFAMMRTSYAKYKISEDVKMNVVIDKTPPNIDVIYYKMEA